MLILKGFLWLDEAVGVVELDGVGVAVWAVGAASRVGGRRSRWCGLRLRGGGPEEVAEVKEMSAVMINDAAVAFNDMACKHLRGFVTVDGVWPEFIDQTGAAFEALDAAHEIDPKNKVVIQNIIRILTDLINGVAYNDTDAYGRYTRRVHRVTGDYSMKMTLLKKEYKTKLQALDPSYKAPEVKKAKVGVGQIILTLLRIFGLTRF